MVHGKVRELSLGFQYQIVVFMEIYIWNFYDQIGVPQIIQDLTMT